MSRRRAVAAASPQVPTTVQDGTSTYRLVRAWPRGRGHLLLELATDDGEHVAGQWFADTDRLTEVADTAPAPSRVAGHVLLQPAGADARLKALPAVLAEPDARLVAHRPGRRAVVHVGAEPTGRDGDPHFVKVVRRSVGPDLARRGTLVHELLDGQVHVPQLRADSEPDRGVLRWTTVPGRTLHDLAVTGHWPPAAAHAAWHAAGRALTRLHGSLTGPITDADLATHSVTDELDAIAHWLDPAVAHGLLDGGLVARAGDRVTAALEAPGAPPVLGVLHRDLHDKQLLLHDGAIGMIDVDTLTVGERALDIANALVHLELRQDQGLLGQDTATAAAQGLREGVAADGVRSRESVAMWARVEDYAVATRLRLAGVYAFRPRWRPVARRFLQQVATGP